VIRISGMAVANEGSMTGAGGWMVAGKVIVTVEGVLVEGRCEKFVGPEPRS